MLKVFATLEKIFTDLFNIQGDIYSSGLLRDEFIENNTNNVRNNTRI